MGWNRRTFRRTATARRRPTEHKGEGQPLGDPDVPPVRYNALMATNHQPIQPWDDEQMVADLLDLVIELPRTRLDRIEAPDMPGSYLMFLKSTRADVVDVLGPASDGRVPIYAGSAQKSLRDRLSRYPLGLRGVEAIRTTDVYVSLLPCASAASARFAEAVLLESPPVFNVLGGWGQMTPGSTRASQRVSPIDALWPGRRWAPAPTIVDRARAHLGVVAYLAKLDPAVPRWPRLDANGC